MKYGEDMYRDSCIECGGKFDDGVRPHRKYCSGKCKARWRKKHAPESVKTHSCRVCGREFDIGSGQHNKWLCSDECRRKRNADSVRNFHQRKPHAEAAYRARTKEKMPPDSNVRRFYQWNPGAPRECEGCGESRVLEIAHKPGFERIGESRRKANSKWPQMVWVLCPTCHRLLDRMNYSPEELGLPGEFLQRERSKSRRMDQEPDQQRDDPAGCCG